MILCRNRLAVFKKSASFRAMYTSGGDITVSVCDGFNTAGLRPH